MKSIKSRTISFRNFQKKNTERVTKLSKKVKINSYARVKKLTKNITALEYSDRNLIALSATSGGIFIISLTNVFGIPIGTGRKSCVLFDYRNHKKIIKKRKK